jgi:hypothetical protein
MKTPILLSIVTGLTALTAIAQDDSSNQGGGENQKPSRKGPPPSRLVLTLDADHDKVISADEIAASPTALATLDKNSDGQLTKDEFARPKPRKGNDAKAREDGDKPSGNRPPPPDRLAGAIDADHDRVITTEEIAAAPESLATLDKNEDGQLTRDEYAPKPRRKPHGPKNDDESSERPQRPGGSEEPQRPESGEPQE